MIKLMGVVVATGALGLSAAPAVAAEDCMAPLPELQQMMQRTPLDEVTRDKIDTLLQDAAGLCREDDPDKARTKFANVRELVEAHIGAHQGSAAR